MKCMKAHALSQKEIETFEGSVFHNFTIEVIN